MKNIREFYGDTIVKLDNYEYKNCCSEFKVEYYKIKNSIKENNKFGIEVIKRVKIQDNEIIEKKKIDNFLDSEEKADKLLYILKRNKVTPICVEDVVDDFKWYWS